VGYNGKGPLNADLPISRYDTQTSRWLTTISQNANGLTSDVISGDGLYHSDGMLFISTGTFGFSVTARTSFSYLQTNSTFTGQIIDAPLRTAVTSFQYTGGELHLARAGGSTWSQLDSQIQRIWIRHTHPIRFDTEREHCFNGR
jgi:hypothetical protein